VAKVPGSIPGTPSRQPLKTAEKLDKPHNDFDILPFETVCKDEK